MSLKTSASPNTKSKKSLPTPSSTPPTPTKHPPTPKLTKKNQPIKNPHNPETSTQPPLNIFIAKSTSFNKKNKQEGLKFLKNIKSNTIPCAFFDPQYRGVLDKLAYGNEGERQKKRHSLQQMSPATITEFITELNRVLTPTGHLFLWIDKFHLCEGIQPWIKLTTLKIVDLITWNKLRIGMGYRTRRTAEYLLILQKSPTRAKNIWTLRSIPDVWDEKRSSHHSHAHPKPILLQQKLIEAVTAPEAIIIDPAAGTFSVMQSATLAGRHFCGCDINPS